MRTLFAFRRCIVYHCRSVLCGSSLPVSVVPSPVALFILVVVLFFFGLLCLWLTHGVTTMVIISNVNSCSVANCFVCVVFMRLIATLHVISFFDDLQEKADPSVPTILCGDFNAVFDRSVHQFGSDPSDLSRESSSSLQHLFDACCTVDIWRYLHPSSSCFSWIRWDGYHASRIDLCGIPYVWVSSVLLCDLHSCPFSDRCGLLTVVSVPDVVPPGPGLWKLNTSILQEQAYVLLTSDFWASWRSSVPRFPSLAKWWDEGKSRIKGLSIRYCCSRLGARSCNRDLLVRLVDHLKSKLDAGSMSCLTILPSRNWPS